MSNYDKAVDFASKDSLTSGDPNKIVKGTEIDDEFNSISVAIGTKADRSSPTFTGAVTMATLTVTSNATFTAVSNLGTVSTADINGGTIDGVTIGATTPPVATFSSVSTPSASITGGSINGATVGASSPSSGVFTTLTSQGDLLFESKAEFVPTNGDTDWKTWMYHNGATGLFEINVTNWAENSAATAIAITEANGDVAFGRDVYISTGQIISLGDSTLVDNSGGLQIFNEANSGSAEDNITIGQIGGSSTGDILFDPAGEVYGLVGGTELTRGSTNFQAVSALPGTPDANTIYFII